MIKTTLTGTVKNARIKCTRSDKKTIYLFDLLATNSDPIDQFEKNDPFLIPCILEFDSTSPFAPAISNGMRIEINGVIHFKNYFDQPDLNIFETTIEVKHLKPFHHVRTILHNYK